MFTSGQLLADRYRLTRRIAVGGMGEVWEAADTRLDRKVAVKVLKPELCGDAEFLHRFRTEARTTASINHPGIASVHDYGETASIPDGPQDTAYLVMELVEGEPLAAIVAKEGRIGAERTLDILEQAGHALQAAHERGYVHRDVKPGNILITPSGVVKLTDFGIAKAADAAPVTRSGMVMGTAHYIAPEQALGHEAEPASDVYSLAVVGYECLTGRRPFLSENAVTVAMMHIRDIPPPLPPDIPPGARAVIEATLVKDPRQRYSSGGEFAAAVAAIRSGLPLPTPSGLALAAAQRHAGPRTGPVTGTHPGLLPVNPHPGSSGFPMQPPHPQRQGRGGLWVAIGVLTIALIVALAIGLPAIFSSDGPDNEIPGDPGPRPTSVVPGDSEEPGGPPAGQPPTTRTARPTQDGDTVTIVENRFTKRSATEVRDELADLGVVPMVLDENGAVVADPDNCLVVEVSPVGRVPRGAPVTIKCRQNGPGG
ncbi:protein kinase domain-containing protein [Actinokineospora diospyrosa]|uniref:non-specific serine/threonine protein kinase n=1 Tax=Actinokineospora diospyrosa TaxID=103728 RepID=A0ABT1ICR5_9PSEU|nr:protein kinase [Actinokineospora diospyrosa]MCP2270432.1 serine/threonine protein kinase [Actinokineospora diospyrosa]